MRRLASTVFAAALLAASPSWAGFVIRTLDTDASINRQTSLQLNASGFAVVAYYDAANQDLKLATCNDATCTAPTIITLDSTGDVGLYPSMQLDANGFPVISYQDNTNKDLKLAVCGDPGCTTRTITVVDGVGSSVGQYTSLQLNASGFPVISYYDALNGDLKVAVCSDTTCAVPTITVVDSTGNVGTYTSLRLSPAGNPTIAYRSQTGGSLKIAACADATCTTATLTTLDSSNAGLWSSLQYNGANPVMSYNQDSSSDLWLATCADPTCTTSTLTVVDPVNFAGAFTSLQLDGANPVISYLTVNGGDGNLMLAVCADPGCATVATYVVDAAGYAGYDTSLQLNGGRPVISYTDFNTGVLKLATHVQATVTSVTVPANANYVTTQDLDFTVNWSEAVTVTGTPQLALTVGASAVNATYQSGSGTSAHVYRYTVLAGDGDSDGIAVGALALNGGTIKDAFGYDATLTLNAVGSTAGVLVNLSYTVTASAGANGTISPNGANVYAAGATPTFTATPSGSYTTSFAGSTCAGAQAGNDYVLTALTASCTVTASFTFVPVRTYAAPSATGSGNLSATFTAAGGTCTYGVSRFIPVTGHPASPPAGTAPAGTAFPHGLFDFIALGCTPGSAITMTVTYPAPLAAGTVYWKYGPTPADPAPHWYVLPATIVGNTAIFTITDGGLGDDDLVANGTIVDQGGPGGPLGGGAGGANGVPTLSEWMLVLLAALVLGLGALGTQRRAPAA